MNSYSRAKVIGGREWYFVRNKKPFVDVYILSVVVSVLCCAVRHALCVCVS